jgi:hypothetical protein
VNIKLDTDTRQVRRDAAGFYRSGAGKNICDHCGHRNVCANVDQTNSCPDYLPALPFIDDVGFATDRPANTMRVGRAWTERLDEGQIIALYDTKLKVIFGYAAVQKLYVGPIVEMLKAHASNNHIMLTTPKRRAPAELGAWMLQNYGPHIIHERTTLTAIYLLRVDRAPPAPDLEGMETPGPGEGGPAGGGEAG